MSINFNDVNIFKDSSLYEYLKENAGRYGFYNYYLQIWHRTYLGEWLNFTPVNFISIE